MEPFVRIVILNYNQSIFTIELVKQLRNQNYTNYEIVVVDNASNYEEKSKLKSEELYNVFYIYSEENLGYSRGNNLGMKLHTNNIPDYFLILNNDIIISDVNLIKILIESFCLDNKIVAVSPLVDTISTGIELKYQIQVRKILSTFDQYIFNCSLFKKFTKRIRYNFLYYDQMPFNNKYTFCDSINGAAFMISNKFMEKNNFLDENTFLYFEEIILGFQIKQFNYCCLLNGYTSIKHLQGLSTNSNSNKLNIKMERIKYSSEIYYFKKYHRVNSAFLFNYKLLKEIEIYLKILAYKFNIKF